MSETSKQGILASAEGHGMQIVVQPPMYCRGCGDRIEPLAKSFHRDGDDYHYAHRPIEPVPAEQATFPATVPGTLACAVWTDPIAANELAELVCSVFVPGTYVPLDVRYGIAHAILREGFIKMPRPHADQEPDGSR